MTDAKRLPNGNILAPRRAEGPNGEIGEGLYEYKPGERGYAIWDRWLRKQQMPPGRADSETTLT